MTSPLPFKLLPRAWYAASFEDFFSHSSAEILGQLAANSNVTVERDQLSAWTAQIKFLRTWLHGRSGFLLLEFNIPRMGLRADAVLLLGGCIVILEFKIGESQINQGALNQVWEYALDTKNFHEPSHGLSIVPVLVPTESVSVALAPRRFAEDNVCQPIAASPSVMPALLDEIQDRKSVV